MYDKGFFLALPNRGLPRTAWMDGLAVFWQRGSTPSSLPPVLARLVWMRAWLVRAGIATSVGCFASVAVARRCVDSMRCHDTAEIPSSPRRVPRTSHGGAKPNPSAPARIKNADENKPIKDRCRVPVLAEAYGYAFCEASARSSCLRSATQRPVNSILAQKWVHSRPPRKAALSSVGASCCLPLFAVNPRARIVSHETAVHVSLAVQSVRYR